MILPDPCEQSGHQPNGRAIAIKRDGERVGYGCVGRCAICGVHMSASPDQVRTAED